MADQKLKERTEMNRMTNFDYMTDDRKNSHPLYNLVMVDGYFVPLNTLPEQYQQMVKEARDQGQDLEFWSE